jgi:hypothetical protein
LLGQAGNREDADLTRLAAVAAAARPDLVVLKEMPSYLRGRDAGEIPAILRRALGDAGVATPRSSKWKAKTPPCVTHLPGRGPATS